jgi:hypothetical protein
MRKTKDISRFLILINNMFAKAQCRLCGDQVRFGLRHLRMKHPEVLSDKDVARLDMSRIMKKYFD